VNLGGKQVFAVDTMSWSDTPGRGGAGAGGAGAGRAPPAPFNISLTSTSDTVLLLKAEANGQVFSTVHLYVLGSPGCVTITGMPFMTFTLSHATISSYKITGTNGDLPEDRLLISSQSVTLTQGGTSVIA
jgi:type VI secretion system (T6SS) effector Hcp